MYMNARVAVALLALSLGLIACGGSAATENPATPTSPPVATTAAETPEQIILFADSTPAPTPTVVLVPAEFTLPETCEEMAAFAEEQADIISVTSPTKQAAIDAKAAFNAVVAEQMLQGCI